ncbi:MAG: hypothetical protein P8Y03_15110 [Anaerolineales bacterium]|jgi:hypothetical protein
MALQTFSVYLTQLPVYLAWLAGIVLAIINWKRHPRAAQLTLAAVFIFFITSIGGTAISSWLPLTLHARGMAARQMGIVLAIINIIRALFNALAFGILFAAIFSWRGGIT